MGKSFDLSPQAQVLEGLQRERKAIPCSLLYDDRGSELYEQITELEEYYPFRVEEARLKEHAHDIASQIPEDSVLVELGCGTARKSGIVLSAVQTHHSRCRFVGIDVSASFLQEARSNLEKQGMAPDCIEMVEGEYMAGLQRVRAMYPSANLCIMWLGSSVGNFSDEGAVQFFREVVAAVGTRCQIFLCADMWKDAGKLYAAYHDKEGVTELFIKNGMRCALALLGYTATADEEKSWEYEVVVNNELRRVEMYLRFSEELAVEGHNVHIASGERVLVEVSRKFTEGDFNRLANDAGFHIDVAWRDSMWGMQILIPFKEALQRCWAKTDEFFRSVPDWCAKPIDVRHPFKFYYGHIQAFTKLKLLPHDPVSPTDVMFSRGIDPNVVDPTQCHSHPEVPQEWPSRGEIERYVTQARTKLITALGSKESLPARLLIFALEHEYMHLETLAYMRAQERKAAFEKKLSHSKGIMTTSTMKTHKSYRNGRVHHFDEQDQGPKMVYISPGRVTIGGDATNGSFMWDNEIPSHDITVRKPFKVSCKPVTVGEFLTFIKAGAYSQPQYWNSLDFAFFQSHKITVPATWSAVQNEYWIHTPTSTQHWTQVANEPVFVSLSEAEAYCKWSHGRVMSEEEYHLTLASKAASKVQQLRSGGWEWTSTLFLPFDGFEKMAEYPEYSSDFFDGAHYVLKGASSVTHRCMQRDTFRNFYQRQYRYVFAKFRVCKNAVSSEN